MTLKISTQEDEQRQLAVTVEVADKRVRKAMQKAAKTYARQLNIPGFRKGKAPFGVVKGYVGEEQLRQDALNDILPSVFDETLKEIDVLPYAQPTLDDVEFSPLVLKMTVPLEPTVVLGEYREMRREIESVEISEEAVDEAIDVIRQQQATTEPVERASASGDEIVINGTGTITVEGEEGEETNTFFNQEHYHVRLEEGNVFPDTDFVDQLMGLSAGDEKSFTVTFPEAYESDEELAGQTATFNITVDEVLERTVPELDDEFAQNQTGEFETLEAFRASQADELQKQAEEQAKNDLIEESITEMLENVEEMTYSPAVVSAETDDMINGIKQQIQQIGMEWDQYLGFRQMTEQDMRDEFEESAVDRLERRLVLQKFVESEKLLLGQEEIDAAISERLSTYDEEMQGYMRPYLEGEGGVALRNEILTEKVHGRVVAILSGEAPDLSEEVEEAIEEETGLEVISAPSEEEPAAEAEDSAEESSEEASE